MPRTGVPGAYLSWLAALPLVLSACAVKLPPEVALDPASAVKAEPETPKPPPRIIEIPKPVPLPGQLKPKPRPVPEDKRTPQEKIADANRAATVEPSKDGFINAIQVYPYTEGALYHLYAAVNQVSDIALEPGEHLVSVSSGDTVRWVIGDTSSGEGTNQRVHILVKPSAPGLATNLVITTGRRSYHLDLSSTDATYIASLSWTYPLSALTALKADAAKAAQSAAVLADPGVAVENLHFRYRIEGEAPWRPTQVFDDGQKVYIQFPSTLAHGEAPPLFVIGAGGKAALVNYRVKGSTYIVDRLFAIAELRLGEEPQRVVRIARLDVREPESWKLFP